MLVLTNTGTAADGRVPNNRSTTSRTPTAGTRSGVNFLFGDGSVRVIPNTIRPAAWEAIGTRAGGEAAVFDF